MSTSSKEGNWTPDRFLYEKFLTQNTRTSRRAGSSPIEVYNAYLERKVDIKKLCQMGANIMNAIQSHNVSEIEPYFLKWNIFWRMRRDNLFGIHLHTSRPRYSFCYLSLDYYKEVHPKYRFIDDYTGECVLKQEATFEEISDFIEEILVEYLRL